MSVILANGTLVARPVFTNITISGGKITGDVHLPIGTRISRLEGECTPLTGLADIAAVTFRFRLKDAAGEIGILMSGVGFVKTGATDAEFRGAWIAHTPVADTPAADKLVVFVIPGSGDTGSGTGTQT